MTFASLGASSRATTDEDLAAPSQAEIDREIAKLQEDSARDVERQLEQQRQAVKRAEVEEDAKKIVENVEERLAPVWTAAEQGVETVVKHVEADVKAVGRERGAREIRK